MIDRVVPLCIGGVSAVKVPVKQNDTMWRFVFKLFYNGSPWEIPSGATTTMGGIKPDGNHFLYDGTIGDNAAIFVCQEQMTAVPGITICDVSILSGGKVVCTANFQLVVEPSPMSIGTSSESVIDAYGDLLSRMEDAEQDFEELLQYYEDVVEAASAVPTIIYVQGDTLVIETNVPNGNEVSY